MKKIIILPILILFAITGCSSQDTGGQVKSDNVSSQRRIIDFERPEENPSISGLVKSVVGNEVTVLKIDRPERTDGENITNSDGRAERTVQRPITSITGSTGGHMPGIGGGIGGGRPGGGETDASARIDMIKSMSTGEEKVVIPVGIKMLKRDGEEMVEATLVDVKTDTMLMIWTDKEITDRNIANFVVIN